MVQSQISPLQQRHADAEALDHALSVIGDRWSLAVVAELANHPLRFNELVTALKPIARTVLSDRLRKLEDAGIIAKRNIPDAAHRWNYRLTIAGGELARVCGVIAEWAHRHLGDGDALFVHSECGASVVSGWRCSDCGSIPAKEIVPVERDNAQAGGEQPRWILK